MSYSAIHVFWTEEIQSKILMLSIDFFFPKSLSGTALDACFVYTERVNLNLCEFFVNQPKVHFISRNSLNFFVKEQLMILRGDKGNNNIVR